MDFSEHGVLNSFSKLLNQSFSSLSSICDIDIDIEDSDDEDDSYQTPIFGSFCGVKSKLSENPIKNTGYTFKPLTKISGEILEFYFKNQGLFPVNDNSKNISLIYVENIGYIVLMPNNVENKENKHYSGDLIIYMIYCEKDPSINEKNEEYFENNYEYKFEGEF